jgi:hypothetical protein
VIVTKDRCNVTIVFTNDGEEEVLSGFLNDGGAPADLFYGFYTNNYTPLHTSVIGNFTLLANTLYTAYNSQGNFTVGVAGGIGSAATPQQTINITGACTVYGYVVVDSVTAPTVAYYAEQWTTIGFTFPAGGGSITFTPTVTAT